MLFAQLLTFSLLTHDDPLGCHKSDVEGQRSIGDMLCTAFDIRAFIYSGMFNERGERKCFLIG